MPHSLGQQYRNCFSAILSLAFDIKQRQAEMRSAKDSSV